MSAPEKEVKPAGRRGMSVRKPELLKRLSGEGTQVELASLASVFLNLGATGMRWLINVFLARWLGSAGFGQFSVLRGLAGLLSRLPNQGYDLALIRWLPKYREAGDVRSYRNLVLHAARATGIAAIVLAIVAALVGWIRDEELTLATVAGSALIITGAVGTLLRQELRASNRHVLGVWLTEVIAPMIFGLLAVAASFVFDPSAAVVLGALALSGVVVVVGEAVAIARYLPKADAVDAGALDTSTADDAAADLSTGSIDSGASSESEWRAGTGSLFIAQLGLAALEVMYLLIIGWVIGNVAAGIFTVANRIALLAKMGNSAVETILSPEFGRLSSHEEGATEAMQAVVDKGIRLSMAFTGAALAVLLVASDFIISVFGEGFGGAKPVLLVLLIGNAVNALTGPTGYLVSMTGSEVVYGYIMAGHGIVGAAIAYAIAGTVGTAVAVALVSSLITVSWNICLIVIGGRRLGVWCLPPLVRRIFGLTPRPVG